MNDKSDLERRNTCSHFSKGISSTQWLYNYANGLWKGRIDTRSLGPGPGVCLWRLSADTSKGYVRQNEAFHELLNLWKTSFSLRCEAGPKDQQKAFRSIYWTGEPSTLETNVCDGTRWSVEILTAGISVKKYDNNMFQEEWELFCRLIRRIKNKRFHWWGF